MQRAVPDATQGQQRVDNPQLGVAVVQGQGKIRDSFAAQRTHHVSTDEHACVFNALERLDGKLVAEDRARSMAIHPGSLYESNGLYAARKIAHPRHSIIVARCRVRPDNDARALSRKEIQPLVISIDGPHERAIEPFLTGFAKCRLAYRAWRELVDLTVFAEVKEAHVGGVKGRLESSRRKGNASSAVRTAVGRRHAFSAPMARATSSQETPQPTHSHAHDPSGAGS